MSKCTDTDHYRTRISTDENCSIECGNLQHFGTCWDLMTRSQRHFQGPIRELKKVLFNSPVHRDDNINVSLKN